MKADWSSSARRAPRASPSGGEHLVPVVADPAAGPAIPAAAGQTHRVGVGRSEERLGRGRAPVDQQPTTRAVREAEPSDVHGLGVVRADHVPEAQVQTEATQGAQASGQPVDLHVPVHRRLAHAAGRLALGIEAIGQLGDRLLEALRDGREVLLVAGDQRRVGLGGEVVGKVERAGGQGIHVISSDLRVATWSTCRTHGRSYLRVPPSISTPPRDPYVGNNSRISLPQFPPVWPRPAILRHDPGLAASPPVRYMLRMEGSGSLLSICFSTVDRERPGEVAAQGLAPPARTQHEIVGVVRAGAAVGCDAGPLLVHLHLPVVVEQGGDHRGPDVVGRVESAVVRLAGCPSPRGARAAARRRARRPRAALARPRRRGCAAGPGTARRPGRTTPAGAPPPPVRRAPSER